MTQLLRAAMAGHWQKDCPDTENKKEVWGSDVSHAPAVTCERWNGVSGWARHVQVSQACFRCGSYESHKNVRPAAELSISAEAGFDAQKGRCCQ